jgi:dsRNA-specific ribonuclease
MVYRGLDKFFGKEVVGVLVELYPDYDEAVLKSADNKLISVIIKSLKVQVNE